MSISCFGLDLFLLCKTMLETLFGLLHFISYIQRQDNLFFSCTLLLQTSTFMDTKFPCEAGREIAPNTGANATKFFTLATKS